MVSDIKMSSKRRSKKRVGNASPIQEDAENGERSPNQEQSSPDVSQFVPEGEENPTLMTLGSIMMQLMLDQARRDEVSARREREHREELALKERQFREEMARRDEEVARKGRDQQRHLEMVMNQQREAMQQMCETFSRRPVRDLHDEAKTKAKKINYPVLKEVREATMADFRTWKEGFEGYASATKIYSDCDLEARRAVVRAALSESWCKLWTTGMLKFGLTDDVPEILKSIKDYLRGQRNALLDRKDFHARDQRPGESINEYYAELLIMYDACNYDDDNLLCPHHGCTEPCGHGEGHRVKEERLRDRLIFGLHDKEIEKKVLEVDWNELTLDKTLSIVQSQESS